MISNNKISDLVNSQLPFHVRSNHPNFSAFLEAYYEFMEQDAGVMSSSQQLLDYNDVDRTIDYFSENLYQTFLRFIPQNAIVDRTLLVKNIQDFYKAKGTEKSLKFMLRLVSGQESSLYYPKVDILKVSDGKWTIQKSLRISGTTVNGISNNNLSGVQLFNQSKIQGQTSNSTAIIERIDRFVENGVQLDELVISAQSGTFLNGETILTNILINGISTPVTANVFGGIINTVSVNRPGLNYKIGDMPKIVTKTGTGGVVSVASVSSGNLLSLFIINGGAGFLVNDTVSITGGGGSGATGNVSNIDTSQLYHQNNYVLFNSIINLEANTLISNTQYSNLNHSIVPLPNANTQLANSLNSFTYGPCGPASNVMLLTTGTNFSTIPAINILANSTILSVGILGRMLIANGGAGYIVNNTIQFNNIPLGTGYGANAIVSSVDANGSITGVKFVALGNTGYPVGGLSYSQTLLPTTNVVTSTGSGANVIVTAVLGHGEVISANTSNVGAILKLIITSSGTNYLQDTSLDFTQIGNGQATGNITVVQGVYSYPGRYLNDDGHISGYNFIENQEYYQNYSYVVQVKNSLKNYKQAVLDLVHPSGMKLLGEYLQEYNDNYGGSNITGSDSVKIKYITGSWTSNLGNVTITENSHNLTTNSKVYLEFTSGDTINISNTLGIVQTITNANIFSVLVSNTTNSSGTVTVGRIL